MTPHVPLQPEEIAASAYSCYNEGAAIVHIHAKDKNGENTADVATFQAIHAQIRSRCNIIIQDSTGGGANLSQEERVNCLKAGPEMASLNMGSLMRVAGPYAGVPFSNLPSEIEDYVTRMKKLGIKPEMEVFSHSMLRDVNNLISKGLVEKPYYIDIVLGMKYQGACDASPAILTSIISMLPEHSIFNCAAVGPAQLPLANMATLLGGCVRVGLEDNIFYRKGELATNAQLVARIVRIAREHGKEPATPDEARQILGLASPQS
jgi:3-keto-5-aminohexanoate cleavage enzyme